MARKKPQTKLQSSAAGFVGIVISAFVIGKFFPVTSLLLSASLLVGGITYIASSDVRTYLRTYFPDLIHNHKSRKMAGGFLAYSVLLLCCSIAAMSPSRSTVRSAAPKSQFRVNDAEIALSLGEIDRALEITRELEADPTNKNPQAVADIRSKAEAALRAKATRSANDRVLRLAIDGTQDLIAKRYAKVEYALREALSVQGATELGDVYKLASGLRRARIAAAEEQAAAGDFATASALLSQAEAVPGAAETGELAEARVKLANTMSLKRLASAKKYADDQQWELAEGELKEALAIKNATDLTDARALLTKVQADRLAAAQAAMEKDLGVANPFEFVRSRMDDEGSILELYVLSGEMSVEGLKAFCKRKRQGSRTRHSYYLVLMDDAETAKFPTGAFRERFRGDMEQRRHIRAIYEFNRLTGQSIVEYFDTTAADGNSRKESI